MARKTAKDIPVVTIKTSKGREVTATLPEMRAAVEKIQAGAVERPDFPGPDGTRQRALPSMGPLSHPALDALAERAAEIKRRGKRVREDKAENDAEIAGAMNALGIVIYEHAGIILHCDHKAVIKCETPDDGEDA